MSKSQKWGKKEVEKNGALKQNLELILIIN